MTELKPCPFCGEDGSLQQARYTELDKQKVKALAKAGWTVEQIEYEFGWRFGIEQIRDALAG